MNTSTRRRFGILSMTVALIAGIAAPGRAASEIWVAPTSQQDVGGLEVASNTIWPVTPAGVVRLAWAIPANMKTFQSAKLALIPSASSTTPVLTFYVCPAESSQIVTANCVGPFTQSFTSTANQLVEIDMSAAIGAHLGTPGTSYVSVLAFTSPTTTTDHIVGLRFAFTPAAVSSTYLVQSAPVITMIGTLGTAVATCNPGDRVLGGGHNTGANDISVGRSYPDTTSSWTVSLKPTAVTISWVAVAVCESTP
jgi:hypothetical protein